MMTLINTDHTGPVVALEGNSGGVLIAHLAVQFQEAGTGPSV